MLSEKIVFTAIEFCIGIVLCLIFNFKLSIKTLVFRCNAAVARTVQRPKRASSERHYYLLKNWAYDCSNNGYDRVE